MKPVTFAILVTLTLAACTLDAPSSAPPGRTNATLDSVPLLVFGSDTDPFYDIVGALLTPDLVIVGDGSSHTLRFYDRHDGDLLRVVGGEGEGPGEFGRLAGLWNLGESIYVWDYELARLSTFRLTGELEETATFDLGSFALASVRGFFPDASSLATLGSFNFTRRAHEPTVRRDRFPLVRYTADGRFLDSLGSVLGGARYVEPYGRVGERSGSALFGAPSGFRVLGSRYFVMDNIDYDIAAFDTAGNRTHTLSPIPSPTRVRVTPEHVERARSSGSDFLQDALDAGSMPIPEFLPPYGWFGERSLSTMTVTTNPDAIWALQAGGVLSANPTWIVFSPDGAELMRIEAPEPMNVLAWDGEIAVVLVWNALDVPTVQLRRIIRD